MRGKGFIYLASDQGPNAFKGPAQAVRTPWNYDGVLLRIMTHELGHVFGIAHTDAGVMASSFSENLILPSSVARYKDSHDIRSFSKTVEKIRRCDFSVQAARWFEVPDMARCLLLSVGERGLDVSFEDASGTVVKLGTVEFHSKGLASNAQVLSTVFAPSSQTLFPNPGGSIFIPSAIQNTLSNIGVYIGAKSGRSKSARVEFSTRGIQILGVDELGLEVVFE